MKEVKSQKKEKQPQSKTTEPDNWAYLRVKESKIRSIELWNIDSVTAVLLAPRFRAFVKGIQGVGATPEECWDIDSGGNFIPLTEGNVTSPGDNLWEKWLGILKKIQYAFDTMEKRSFSEFPPELSEEEKKKVEQGMLLFAKNYFLLWY